MVGTTEATADACLADALATLRAHARPDELAGMARFGMNPSNRLGLAVPTLRALARGFGRNHALALALWETGIADARILASMVADPARLTSAEMDQWVSTFDSWDVCDQTCQNAFRCSPLAWAKVVAWASGDAEFERRAAFALLACLACHDKAADDARFVATFPLVRAAADDSRNYVRKAVNWALRCMGKRNASLHAAAIGLAEALRDTSSRPARWIATDALRELRSPAVCARLGLAARPADAGLDTTR